MIVPLQSRILDLLSAGPVAVKDLPRQLADVDRNALDCAINALMRANTVGRTWNSYELVSRLNGRATASERLEAITRDPVRVLASNGYVAAAPPSAAQEAAASLQPQTFPCTKCPDPLPREAFGTSIRGNRRKVCKRCESAMRAVAAYKSRGVDPDKSLKSQSGGGHEATAGVKSASRCADDRGYSSARRTAIYPAVSCDGTVADPGAAQRADDTEESTQDSAERRSPGGTHTDTPSLDESNQQSVTAADPISSGSDALNELPAALDRPPPLDGGSRERADESPTDSGAKLPDGTKPSPTPAALDPLFAAILERFEELREHAAELTETADKAWEQAETFATGLNQVNKQVREELGLEGEE
jgi:hypothetical protein